MKAAYITGLGDAGSIIVGDLPEPIVGADEVLVKVEYTAVNHVDTFVRSGAYPTRLTFPFVVGRDLVGTVTAVGSEAAGSFVEGQRVWSNSLGYDGRPGAASELVAVPAERLYPLPEAMEPRDLVAFAHPGAAAILALYKHAELRPGETVVVAGAAGNVGRADLRYAAHAGARVVAVARQEHWPTCFALGATTAVDYSTATYPDALAASCDEGVDVYLDTSGRIDLDLVTDLLARRGRIVVMAGLHARPTLPLGPLYVRDGRLVGFAISNAPVPDLTHAAAALTSLRADDPVYTSQRVTVLPLSQAAHAHQLLEQGGAARRRLVLHLELD